MNDGKYIDASKLYAGLPGYVQGSDTSRDAAISMQEASHVIRAKIYEYLKEKGGATCDDIEIALHLTHQTASARLSELSLKFRLIHDSGARKPTRSGRSAKIWTADDGKQKRLL